MLVKYRVKQIGIERGLRDTTLRSYEGMLRRLGLMDREEESVTREELIELLWTIENVNVRRATVICFRSVFRVDMKIPKGIPRRYDLPSEDTLRLAFMQSRKYEVRFLLMAYAGLRVGEACAVTAKDVHGDQLRVDKQIVEIYRKGEPRSVSIGPVKTNEASITIPHWLADRCQSLQDTVIPSNVRNTLLWCGEKLGVHLNPHALRHLNRPGFRGGSVTWIQPRSGQALEGSART